MITENRIKTLRQKYDEVPYGEWKVLIHSENYGQGYGSDTFFIDTGDGELLKIGMADDNADYKKFSGMANFIADSRRIIDELLDSVSELKARLDEVKTDSTPASIYFEMESLKKDRESLERAIYTYGDDNVACDLCRYFEDSRIGTCKRCNGYDDKKVGGWVFDYERFREDDKNE